MHVKRKTAKKARRQSGCVFCDSLVEGVRQGLHGFDGHQAVEPSGEQRALPHALLPRVPHHQQVILLKRQLLLHLHLLVLITPPAHCLGEEGPWAGWKSQIEKVNKKNAKPNACKSA